MLDIATGMHYISEKGLVHRVRFKFIFPIKMFKVIVTIS